jgi:oligopeptide transport system substrate-binding protein
MPRRSSPGRLPRLVGAAAILLLALGALLPSRPAQAAAAPLRYLGGDYATLDPAYIGAASDVQLLLQLYAGLTRLDENGVPYPSLASSWDESADGLTYTFHLRPGLTFSDGSPLTAADVRRSWLRILDPQTQSTAPDVLTVIDGAAARLAGGPEADVGIAAPDDLTLVVRLEHPAAYFTAITATPTAFVVPRSATAGPDWQQVGSFVGSGPYVASRLDSDALVLAANPRYVAGPPPITEVRWITTLNGDPVTAFANNDLDLTAVAPSDAGWIAYDPDLGTALHQAAALNVEYYGFDTTRPPFNDPRVRQAFAMALDRPRLVQLAEGDGAAAASSIVPPALWPTGMVDDQTSDPAEARQLLDEAGYQDRSKLGTITVDGTGLATAPAVAAWRSELGVQVNVETMDFRDDLQSLAEHRTGIFTINWIADYPSPYALYSLLLLPDAASNYGGWNDPTFVSLLDAASVASSDADAAAAYVAVDAYVDDQVPVIPWAYGTSWWLARSGLRGLGNLTIGLLDFGRVSWDG